jgi:alpha-L-rhamnosidase
LSAGRSPQADRASPGTPKLAGLRTEYLVNPLGSDVRKPRLSWVIQSETRGFVQSAYQIQVARNERDLRAGSKLLWDSGKVNSDESIHRVYDGPAVEQGRRYLACIWVGGQHPLGRAGILGDGTVGTARLAGP